MLRLTFRKLVLELTQGILRGGKPMSLYNEVKATQVSVLLLEQSGGSMGFLQFNKIIYNIEREALRRWSYPVTHSRLCSMGHGQMLSEVFDNTKAENVRKYWDKYIQTSEDRKTITLLSRCSCGKLCKAEVDLIREIYSRDKEKDLDMLIDEHHKYPEYVDPGESSIPTNYKKLLTSLGKTKEQIADFNKEIRSASYMRRMAS